MDYGLCLPNFRAGAAREGMEAGAEAAERLGWSTVWTTDHVMVPTSAADDYGTNYDAIEVLAWIGARFDKVRLGTSVIVVPQRNAVVLAKELDAGRPERRAVGGRRRWRLECRRVPQHRRRGSVPRSRRLPRRDDRPLATCLVGLDRALPRPIP